MQKTSQTLPAAVRPWPLTLARGELCEYGPLFVYAWFATAIACMLLWTRDAIASSAEFLAVSSVSAVAGLAVAYGICRLVKFGPKRYRRVCAPLTGFFAGALHVMLMYVPDQHKAHVVSVVAAVVLDILVGLCAAALTIWDDADDGSSDAGAMLA